MAILEIKKFNDKVLRKRARKVRKVDKEIRELVVDMAQTMAKGQGIGLAAPQVGVLRRVIVIHGDFKGQRILGLINPKITKMSKEKEKDMEGCLSFPGIFLEIKRAKEIKVKGLDINGKKIRLKAKGLLARVFQHEIDHLDGIVFYNRLSFFSRILFKIKHFRGFN
ncbi:peptide deformylase [Patescibacteria group bacterium]|nr:peptide deformylase [Patescibacteria group bacterium]